MKRLTDETLKEKDEYREFFLKFKNSQGLSYLMFINKHTDRASLSSFVNNKVEVRQISLAKLERLKQEMIENFKNTYKNLMED